MPTARDQPGQLPGGVLAGRLRAEPPHWVRDYVGLPFRAGGRDRAGVDCWGLVRLVYRDRFGLLLPSLDLGARRGDEVLREYVEGAGAWELAGEPRLGDVIELAVAGSPHVALLVAPGVMLHALEGADSALERLDSPLWARRVRRSWRYRRVHLTGLLTPPGGPRIDLQLPAGLTVAQMVDAIGGIQAENCRFLSAGAEIPRECWPYVRPRAGTELLLVAIPAGGGGGKSVLRVVLSIAVVAAAAAMPGWLGLAAGTFKAAAVSAVGAVGGTLLLNALIPAPRPRLSAASPALVSPTITGARNVLVPYGPVPVIAGRHRIAPQYAARPYTELVGDDQYLRLLFVVGYGPNNLEALRIGETSLWDFDGVEVEIRLGWPDDEPIGIFPGQVREEELLVRLLQTEGWQQQTTHDDTDEISIDISFLEGLGRVGAGGSVSTREVELEVQYRESPSGAWVSLVANSPTTREGLTQLYRAPSVRLFRGQSAGDLGWAANGSIGGAKPGYLPTTDGAWLARGYLRLERGTHVFAVDGSDACDLAIETSSGVYRAAWYGTHGPEGSGGVPGWTDVPAGRHVTVSVGTAQWARFWARVEYRGTNGGAFAAGWKRPGAAGFDLIRASDVWRTSTGTPSNGYVAEAYDISRQVSAGGAVRFSGASAQPVRRGLSWLVPRGRYDVRVRRLTADSTDPTVLDKAWWTVLRSLNHDPPVRLRGLTLVALRIRATNQLSGIIDQFNCIVHSFVPDWDRDLGQWMWGPTSNPAAAYLRLLTGPMTARPLATERIDLQGLQDWHEWCAAEGMECNAVFDAPATLWDRLEAVASCGRAMPAMRDGLFSVIRDIPRATPTQHLTPRNSSGFRATRLFPDLPHALRVRFLNRDKDWQQDELVVYDDGYTAETASRFEALELLGVTAPHQAWRTARYYMAAARLRPESYELTVDAEHLACVRGDLVLVSHDVPSWGGGAGRVAGLVHDSAGNLRRIVLDDPVEMTAGGAYRLRVRLEDGTSWSAAVATAAGKTDTLELSQIVGPGAAQPAKGDLWMFGEERLETVELIVKDVRMGSDLAATLTLVDAAPGVHTADLDAGESVGDGWGLADLGRSSVPEPPAIIAMASDESAMARDTAGHFQPRIRVRVGASGGWGLHGAMVELRYRAVPDATPVDALDSGGWLYLAPVSALAGHLSIPDVRVGLTYEIEVRAVMGDGRASAWASAAHTVVGLSVPLPVPTAAALNGTSNGGRVLVYAMPEDPSAAGVVLRHGEPGHPWHSLLPLHDRPIVHSPHLLMEPAAGTWQLELRSIDHLGEVAAEGYRWVATIPGLAIDGGGA